MDNNTLDRNIPHRHLLFASITLGAISLGCSDDVPQKPQGAVSDAAVASSSSTTASNVDSSGLFGGNLPNTEVTAPSSSAPNDDNPNVDSPIVACSDAIGGRGSPLVDDFEDGNMATIEDDGRDGTWYFYDDATPGNRDSTVDVDTLGERSGQVLNVTGEGFTDWGSGFGAGLHWNTAQCTYDASTYDGVQFWLRGSGSTRVTLQNLSVRPENLGGQCPTDATCFDSHGVDLTLEETWTLVQLPFTDFEQAGWGTSVGRLQPEAIYVLEFQFGTVTPYSVWLDDVSFYRNSGSDAGTESSASTLASPQSSTAHDAGSVSPQVSAESSTGAISAAPGSDLDAGNGQAATDASL